MNREEGLKTDRRVNGALSDLTVLDLTRVVAGPFCSSLLGDMGARIIKIEKPGTGDDSRAYGPYVNGESAYFAMLNRSKYGVTLNLKTVKGKEMFLEFVKSRYCAGKLPTRFNGKAGARIWGSQCGK